MEQACQYSRLCSYLASQQEFLSKYCPNINEHSFNILEYRGNIHAGTLAT